MKISVILEALTGSFETDMNRASKTAQKRMKEIEKNIKASAQVIGVAFVAAVGAITVGVKNAIDQADKLNDLNVRLGISAEALAGWSYAAKQSGTDIDALGIGLKKLAKNVAEAVDPKSGAGKLFEALDIEPIDKATGKLIELEKLLPQIADRFKEIDDETLEAALSMQLLGKSGSDLLEFLNLGSDGLQSMQERAAELGFTLTEETMRAADEFNDKLGDLKTASDAFFMVLAADLLPELTNLISGLVEAAKEGSNTRGVIDGLVTVFHYVVDVCRDIDSIWRGLVSTGIALYNVADNLSKLNPGAQLAQWITGQQVGDDLATNWREAGAAFDQAGEAFKQFGKDYRAEAAAIAQAAPKGIVHTSFGDASLASLDRMGRTSGLEGRLQALLGDSGGGGKPKKAGKSEAEKEAEQLEEAFQRMHAQMAETIALYGQESEAAQVRYDLEHGDLKELSEAKKEQLLQQAQVIDQLKLEAEEKDRLNKLDEERLDTIREARESVAQTLSDMQFELDLMGKTNAERVAEIELRRIAAGLTEQERDAARVAIEEKAKQLEAMSAQVAAMDEFRQSFEDTLFDVVTGTKSIKDAFRSLADDLIQQLLRIAAHQLTESLLGPFGGTGTGSSGGWLGSLFGMFTGGGSGGSNPFAAAAGGGFDIPGFALGTDYAPGGLAWVGESGKELVELPEGARVIPNHRLPDTSGGGFTQNIANYYAAPTDLRTQQQMARQNAEQGKLALTRAGR